MPKAKGGGEFGRKAVRAGTRLVIGAQLGRDAAIKMLRSGEGVWVKRNSKAIALAKKYSIKEGGPGKIEADPPHPLGGGKYGSPHVHALDARGERLPGHIWYGTKGAFVFMLDATGNGEIELDDIFDLAKPLFFDEILGTPPQTPEEFCKANPALCA